MAIENDTIAVYEPDDPSIEADAKELVEALKDFFCARSTRALIRSNEHREVKCALRVPLANDGHLVRPSELGRTLRKVVRRAVDAASPDDLVLVDFVIVPGSGLEVRAGPSEEMEGPDRATYEAIFGR